MALPIRSDTTHYSYADIITWPDDARWELIDGIPYNISPAPSLRHQRIVSALMTEFGNFLKGHPCEHFTAPFDVRLPKPTQNGMTADTVVQPDLLVVCDAEKLDEHGCVGAPTLVVEILSPATQAKDLREKRVAYQLAGVPEYWLISPNRTNLTNLHARRRGALWRAGSLFPWRISASRGLAWPGN